MINFPAIHQSNYLDEQVKHKVFKLDHLPHFLSSGYYTLNSVAT